MDSTAPPRPILAVQVGATGHRALPDGDVAALRDAAAQAFRAVREQVLEVAATDRAATIPLYAPGPPKLRCVCGIAEGADSIIAEAALDDGWELVALLPFEREEFAKDFATGPALDRYRRLLARASAVSELDGVRGRGGEPYAEVGGQIVEQSTLLLAIWDGLPPRGPGGTGDVVQRAVQRGIPVGVLPPSGPAVVTWHGGDGPGTLGALLIPQTDTAGFPQAYLMDRPRSSVWAQTAERWFEAALLLGWRPACIPQPTVAQGPDPWPALVPYFDAADRAAGAYAIRYRLAGLLRYGLVLPATAGSFAALFGPVWVQPAGYMVQFLSLGVLVLFLRKGGWERAQQRFVAERAAAEFFRYARLLAPLGAVPSMLGEDLVRGRTADWTSWYGPACLRGLGLPPVRMDPGRLDQASEVLRRTIADQVAFLDGRAARYSELAVRLRRVGLALSISGIALNVVHAAFRVSGLVHDLDMLVSELALVLPGLAPVFLGMLAFGEYGRLADRYRAVAAALTAEGVALEGSDRRRVSVLRIARRVTDLMLAETADWRLLIRARTLSAL